MKLVEALQVIRGAVVALVGAGGKTTALYRLARELAAQDPSVRVVVTTTTKLYPPSPDQVRASAESGDLGVLLAETDRLLREQQAVLVSRGRVEVKGEVKLDGVPPEWVESLRDLPRVYAVLVEADGAAKRSFKAPGDAEPVIPAAATLMVPVVGLDAIGVPLTSEFVHRPEQVARLTGASLGEPLTVQLIAEVVAHPEGLAKGRPAQALTVPLLNKADTPERLEQAQELAQALFRRGFPKVVVTHLYPEPATIEVVTAPQPVRS